MGLGLAAALGLLPAALSGASAEPEPMQEAPATAEPPAWRSFVHQPIDVHTETPLPLGEFVDRVLIPKLGGPVNVLMPMEARAVEVPPVNVRGASAYRLLQTLGHYGEFEVRLVEPDHEGLEAIVAVEWHGAHPPEPPRATGVGAPLPGSFHPAEAHPPEDGRGAIHAESSHNPFAAGGFEPGPDPFAGGFGPSVAIPMSGPKPAIRVVALGRLDPRRWDRHCRSLTEILSQTLSLEHDQMTFVKGGQLLIVKAPLDQAMAAASIAQSYVTSVGEMQSRVESLVAPLQAELLRLEREHEVKRGQLGDDHPEVDRSREAIERLHRQIEEIEAAYTLR